MKKGSQQIIKIPITAPNVFAAFFSLVNLAILRDIPKFCANSASLLEIEVVAELLRLWKSDGIGTDKVCVLLGFNEEEGEGAFAFLVTHSESLLCFSC